MDKLPSTWNYCNKKTIRVLLLILSIAAPQVMSYHKKQGISHRYKTLKDFTVSTGDNSEGRDLFRDADRSVEADSFDEESKEENTDEKSRLVEVKGDHHGHYHRHHHNHDTHHRRSKDKHSRGSHHHRIGRRNSNDRGRRRMISNGNNDNEGDDERDEAKRTPGGSKMYPKTPITLPIVTSQMVEESESEYAKLISTQNQPFHFHIPLVKESENVSDENSKKWDELEAEAKKYKPQLNFDKQAILESVTDFPMMKAVAGRSAAWTRMVRDSPVLDFLNLAVVLEKESDHEGLEILGDKREVVHLQPTDEVLQELVGDEDDLLSIHSSRKDLKSNHHHNNKIRKKRGLFGWIKNKLFGKKTTTTTTTTTTTRRPTPPAVPIHPQYSQDSNEFDKVKLSSDNKLKFKAHKKKTKSKYFQLQTDSHGDTEVDSLLPPALRRSSYYKKLKHEDDTDDYNYDEDDQVKDEEQSSTHKSDDYDDDHEHEDSYEDYDKEKVKKKQKSSKSRWRKKLPKKKSGSSSSSSSEEK